MNLNSLVSLWTASSSRTRTCAPKAQYVAPTFGLMKSGVTWFRLRRNENKAESSYLSSRFSCPCCQSCLWWRCCCCSYFSPSSGNRSGENSAGTLSPPPPLSKSAKLRKNELISSFFSDASLHLARLQVRRRRYVEAHGRAVFSGVTHSSVVCASWVPAGSAPRYRALRCSPEGSAAERMRLQQPVFRQETRKLDLTACVG